ncbi:MarR family transcriptional regulator [Micromonospora sp. NBC_00362]|uniref:MarR family transcriptional regulator n=1 Tax=Micromonospora sp. NBC_00362 TaxID=2975975 RepID=UPI0022593535|nr:MarR family transcriptional regulator [Micromonospora sp. NBC_00362]MCX5122001.1 MarR family transcriptional regulator [Micromonospora sp. NBC_00362]
MTDTAPHVPAHTRFKVLAALGELGDATAAAVAEHSGLGYSTTTGKLRAWEQTGQVEKVDTDGNRTLWRLTDTGRATTVAQADPPSHAAATDPTPGESEPTAPDTAGFFNSPIAVDPPQQDSVRVVPPDGPIDDAAFTPADQAAPPETATPRHSTEIHPPSAGTEHEGEPADVVAGPDAAVSAGVGSEVTSTAADRRVKGSLRGAVLDILEAHPDRQYKTGELCKLIDAANAGTGARKASGGAVFNAAVKLVAAGTAVQTVEKPATFQYASPSR